MSEIEEGLEFVHSLAEWKGTGDFTLDNVRAILAEIGDPQDRIPSIHVTGTNGKGSCSVGIASILGAAGYRVGLTISPHLARFNERIVIDGAPVSDELISRHAIPVKRACEKLKIKLSFFEGITAIAFSCFAAEKLDFMVVEVGLGGRLDATNCIKRPECSVITSIDLEHVEILGSRIEQIAAEKAGIIKPGSRVVVGPVSDEALEVIESKAVEVGAECFRFGHEFKVRPLEPEESREKGKFKYFSDEEMFDFKPSLAGAHQGINMSLAVFVASLLGVDKEVRKRGVAQVFWPGRLERCTLGSRQVLIDSAHNVAGVQVLTNYLKQGDLSGVEIAFGVLDRKDWKGMVDLLIPFVSSWNVLRPDSTRSVDPSLVCEYVMERGGKAKSWGTDYAGFMREMSAGDSLLLLTGSMYLIGKLREYVATGDRQLWKIIINSDN